MPAIDFRKFTPEQLDKFANTSAIPPPNGAHSNFVDPPSRAGLQIGTTSAVFALAILACLNRLYVKTCLMRHFAWDDACLLMAMLLSIVVYVAATWGVQEGKIGRHNWDITVLDTMQPDFMVPLYMLFLLPPIALLFLKATFFLCYLQFFSVLRWARICCYIGLAAITILHGTIGIYSFAIASPYRSDWAHRAEAPAMAAAVLGLIIDIAILMIPIIAIDSLKLLSLQRKMGAILVFMTGILACFCSAFNIHARRRCLNEPDQTWQGVIVTIATVCELFVGIVCACAPTAACSFRNSNSFWRKVFPKQSSTTSESAKLKMGHKQFNSSYTYKSSIPSDMLQSTDRKYSRYFELNEKAPIVDVKEVPVAHVSSPKSVEP